MLAPAAAPAAFPGTDPNESPRVNTPNDSDFDACEADDEDGTKDCTSYFEEEFRKFGFSPDSANMVPDPGALPHYVTGTSYVDCSQLDQAGRDANARAEGVFGQPAAEQAGCLTPSGIRADQAWKYSIGSPEVSIAILDTGIEWQDRELREKIGLNTDELPVPLEDRAAPLDGDGACPLAGGSGHDGDGDGAVNVMDYRCDSRLDAFEGIAAGDQEADTLLDGSDLIAAFSNSTDADSNGYVDDIAGWDFFDDDNDPFDASSLSSWEGHGTGRGRDAAADTNNGSSDPGTCPECQIMPLRVWDSFVVPIDLYAMGVVYAADNGASVVEGAVGGLGNTDFARGAFEYADGKGLSLMMVSSDINSANHNYPTNYNEAVYVAGSYPDTAPNETCSGPGGLPGFDGAPNPPGQFEQGCQAFLGILAGGGVTPTAQPVTTSFFRNSNLTQYGGKADIVLESTTGSENTGQAAGAAGLIASYGREQLEPGGACHDADKPETLSGNEIRQLITMTAEDVLAANTGAIGQPDKAATGWDPHFGYGRLNLPAAMKRIEDCLIPPEVQIDAPDWFAPINVDRLEGDVPVTAQIAAPHGEVGNWRLEYACGQDAPDSAFQPVPGAAGSGAVDGEIGVLSRPLLETLASGCNGEVVDDAGRPAGPQADGTWPDDPYPNPDPERHAFQIRLTAESTAAFGGELNFGRYRKTLFAYEDDGNLAAWPRPLGEGASAAAHVTRSGGEVSPRLYDLDGDNELDILQGTTSGEIYALHADGSPVTSFNGGRVTTNRYQLERNHPVPGELPGPRESPRVPAIGDVDGDREAEVVTTGGEHIYAWNLDGSPVPGFEGDPGDVGADPSLSDPCVPGAPHPCFDTADRAINPDNHIKRGFIGSPALADLDCDGALDIVAAGMDQHLYAWDGGGSPVFAPKKLATEGVVGAEIVTSPAVAELDGKRCGEEGGGPEVVVSTNELIERDCCEPEPPPIFGFISFFLASGAGSNPVYAVHGDGSDVDGWPVRVGVAAGDLLPLVFPGHDPAVLDADGDGNDEVSVSGGTSITPGGTRLVDGNGSTIRDYAGAPSDGPDQGPIFNLADYQSIGDILGDGSPAVVKGGGTVNLAVNLLAANQNLAFSHVEQAWDPATGSVLPGFPKSTDDYQLLSQASIARVGDGPGRQALVGTGLYNLHAYGPGGIEPAGWPKFTGGWQQATPAVGDADGDGDLDVTTVTREGWSFLWDTGVDACAGSNDEWWGFHHDERNSANYSGDGRPPGAATELLVARERDDDVALGFTAPGDDWLCGKADRFQVLVDDEPIRRPADGTVAGEFAAEGASGETQRATVAAGAVGAADHVAVLYRDEAGNWGHLTRAEIPPGRGGPGGGAGPGPAIAPAGRVKRRCKRGKRLKRVKVKGKRKRKLKCVRKKKRRRR